MENNLIVNPASAPKEYYFQFDKTLEKNKWYILEIFLNNKPISSGYYMDPIIFMTTSKFDFTGVSSDEPDVYRIIYDRNYAFAQIYIADAPRYVDLTASASY